jgi:carboxyl-terminal processing protease
MRSLVFTAALLMAAPATALDKDRALLARDISFLANRVQSDYIEDVSQQIIWQKLVDAFRQKAQSSDRFDGCTGPDILTIPTQDQRISALDTILRCGASDDDWEGYADGALKAFVPAVDPLGSFITKADLEAMVQQDGGQGGVGLALTRDNGVLEIVRIDQQSPLLPMGFKKGDVIEALDGRDTTMITLDDSIRQLRGPVGSSVNISIRRQRSDKAVEVVVTRKELKPENFALERRADSLVVRYHGMGDSGAWQLRKVLEAPENSSAKRLIIDLRGNKGGLLDEAVALADLFIEAGELFKIAGRRQADIERYRASKGDVWKGKPMTVLIDKTSENGAEMLAAALQDNKRATIVGEKTSGMVLIQSILPIRMDYAVRLTTSKVFRSGDKPMRDLGVAPDIAMPPPPANASEDWWTEYALQIQQGAGHLQEPGE